MKRLFLVFIALALPVMLFARGASQTPGQEGGYLRFAWWGNPTRDERTLKLVDLFMQKNPGVTVDTETTNFAGYWDNLAAQAAAGNLPDVMQQDYAYIDQYNSRNMLVDLTPFAQKNAIDLSKWSDAGLSGGRLGGKLIGLNLGVNAWGVEVDPAILQRAGVTINDSVWTWSNFESAAMQIYQRTGIQTLGFGADMYYQIIENAVRYHGIPFYAPGGRTLGFTNNPAALASIKELLDVQLRLKAAGALYDPQDAFVAGRAMPEMPISQGKTWNNWNWSNQHVGYVGAANKPLDFYICPAPSATGMKAPYGTYLKPSMLISMLSTSKNQDLAAKFINFFVNDLEANRILLAERGVPIPTSVLDDLSSRVDPNMKYTFDYITKATRLGAPIDPPDPARAGEARDSMRPVIMDCLNGGISSDAAVTQMVQAANAVLSR
jgi:multiple sugar transport system substrate-binding protein